MPTSTSINRTIREHQECSIELSEESANALRAPALVKRLTITPDFTPGRYTIRTGSFVGRIVVPGLSLQIKPKVTINQVLSMIRPDRLTAGMGEQHDRYMADDLADAIAGLYQRSVADALARGMRRDYVVHEDRLIAVRGRIDLQRQMRTPLSSPIACQFDEYTIDTQHNRLLKAALRRLLRIEGVRDRTRSAILRTLQWFGDVADQTPPIEPLLRRGFGRLDLHYEAPCRLAALIIESSSLGDEAGELTASTFLIDMNKVFEEFVEDRLRRRLPAAVRLEAQFGTYLDLSGQVAIKPDLLFSEPGRPSLVADIKYKEPDDHEGGESDLYQVVAYATALGIRRAMLIYATDVDRPTVRLKLRNDRSIDVVHLNVAGSPAGVDAGLQSLVDLICQ